MVATYLCARDAFYVRNVSRIVYRKLEEIHGNTWDHMQKFRHVLGEIKSHKYVTFSIHRPYSKVELFRSISFRYYKSNSVTYQEEITTSRYIRMISTTRHKYFSVTNIDRDKIYDSIYNDPYERDIYDSMKHSENTYINVCDAILDAFKTSIYTKITMLEN